MTINPDADMTMMSVLDMTVQESTPENIRESYRHHESQANADIKQGEVGRDTTTNDADPSTKLDSDMPVMSEDAMWTKANSMMGDLDNLGQILKSEIEGTVKSITNKQNQDRNQISSLSRTVEDLQTEVNSLKLNISALNSSILEIQIDKKNEISKLEENHGLQVAHLNDMISKLDSHKADLKNENALLESELKIVRENLNSKKASNIDVDRIDNLSKEIVCKDEEIHDLKAKMRELELFIKEQEASINTLEDDNAKLSTSLLEKDSDISDLQEKLQNSEDAYMGQIGLLGQQITSVQASMEQESADKNYYMTELNKLIESQSAVQEKYKESKKEVKQLEIALDAAKKSARTAVSLAQLKYYQELERKYVQTKK